MEFRTSAAPVPYEHALSFMDARVDGIYNGTEEECVWLLEHPPLYTAGTSAKPSDLLNPQFPVYTAGRGGEYTYHGPGQRVAYVMMDLRKRQKGPDIKAYVWFLEEWIIRSLAEFGIKGERICGRVGIWVGNQKIAAIGVRVRRWVTLHGIAINVNPDLSHFGGIVPCGIHDAGVTSMTALGVPATMRELDEALQRNFDLTLLNAQAMQCQ